MSKKEKNVEETKKVTVQKKKKSPYEKRKFFMKVAGWIMALVMIIGTLISIFGMLLYR